MTSYDRCAGRDPEFVKRMQESDGVFPAQLADDVLRPDDGHLVYAISVHLPDCRWFTRGTDLVAEA